MGKLKQVILSGWPNKRREVPADIQEYWNYRDELSEVNDIILKGEKLVISPSMRKEMLTKIHTSEGPATSIQSCTGCLKSRLKLTIFCLERVNFSIIYTILSVISSINLFRKFLSKFVV